MGEQISPIEIQTCGLRRLAAGRKLPIMSVGIAMLRVLWNALQLHLPVIRLVDACFHELALDASNDPSPPTREEQIADAERVAAFERLKAMTPDELRAERARRIRERRCRDRR